jgi:formylmethanofuran dehydrogenase subunit E
MTNFYQIEDKEGFAIVEADTEENALYAYQQWAEDQARDDGEYYEWQEQVDVICYSSETANEISRCERCAIMDTRREFHRDAYSDDEYRPVSML